MNDQNHDNDVYGSGLNSEDWISLKDMIWPFVHADDPGSVEIPAVPPYLKSHPVVQWIKKYQSTGDKAFLDKAGHLLIPTRKPFGWYLPLTK
jgi:hypothetical protein